MACIQYLGELQTWQYLAQSWFCFIMYRAYRRLPRKRVARTIQEPLLPIAVWEGWSASVQECLTLPLILPGDVEAPIRNTYMCGSRDQSKNAQRSQKPIAPGSCGVRRFTTATTAQRATSHQTYVGVPSQSVLPVIS